MSTDDLAPISLSFPAILRNPNITDRYAHLREGLQTSSPSTARSIRHLAKSRDDKEGKRWIRRRENAKFAGNPHIVQATRNDFSLEPQLARRTFPEPLPAYLSRHTSAPSIQHPKLDPASANSGRFSLGLKGIRRELRKAGPRTQFLVRDIETEIIEWLAGGTLLRPDASIDLPETAEGRIVGQLETIAEVSRTPLQLVWAIESDAYARYIVHCCARYHKVVSFSKDTTGRRLTYLLRPNVTRPDHAARNAIDTPPVTDLEYSSHGLDSEHDSSHSDRDTAFSDVAPEPYSRPLSALSEHSDGSDMDYVRIATPPPRTPALLEETGSIDGDDAYVADVDVDHEVALSIGSLTLDVTPRQRPMHPQLDHLWHRRGAARSTSSPSRSPSRRPPRRKPGRLISLTKKPEPSPCSFFDYLYA